jgi:uncharacterized protein (TIGR02145 family)
MYIGKYAGYWSSSYENKNDGIVKGLALSFNKTAFAHSTVTSTKPYSVRCVKE